MSRVLLVDDDVELSAMLSEFLAREGFETSLAHDGESGVAAALGGGFDIVVIDVMMPGISGIESLRRIRARSAIPVLMLTARGDDVDRVVGLELGADDYVPKPCSPRELVARLRAILRRTVGAGGNGLTPDAALEVGALAIWPHKRLATWRGDALQLTSTEFNLLEALVRRVGSVVPRSELSEMGLGRPLTRFDRSIDVHLSSIRQKLGRYADGRSPIETVRGMGYLYVAE